MRTRLAPVRAGLGLLFGLLLVGCGIADVPPKASPPATVINNTVTPEPTLAFIEFLTCCNLPPPKATVQSRVALTWVAAATAAPTWWAEQTAQAVQFGTPTPRPTEQSVAWPTGITNGPSGLPPGRYNVKNGWQSDQNGVHYIVYAGALQEDAEQGFITVTELNFDQRTAKGRKDYLTPTKAGAVHVIGAEGTQVQLQTASGTLFYFDVATRQWVNP